MCVSLSLLDYRTERASEKKRGMKTLLELRQRSRGYEPVNIDDDFELVPVHYPSRTTQFDRTTFEDNSNEIDDLSRGNLEQKKKKSSNFYAWCLLILSISGVIFLSIIALMLKSNSIYITVSKENTNKKQSLGDSVVGAAILYLLTGVMTAIYIVRSPIKRRHHFDIDKD